MRERVVNQYKILRKLGSGAHGIVYYGFDTQLLRPVVLKMLRRGFASSAEVRQRILREARLASSIEHPNVCSVYEVDEVDGQTFIAMQFVPGRSLDKLIGGGAMSTELCASIGYQVADGLAAAHDLRIVHRDLKPPNIMITEGGVAKILDFGLAKREPIDEPLDPDEVASSPATSLQVGTIGYMAPELFAGASSSERSDIFALGVILYAMATGAHPFFQVGDPNMVARAIQYITPRAPRELRAEVSPELESVILKALTKDPSGRYDSAAEMRDALKTALRSATLAAEQADAEAVPLSSEVPAAGRGRAKSGGLLAGLADLFGHKESSPVPQSSIAVLPLSNLGGAETAPFYGHALADALRTRLARLPDLVVRPAASFKPAQNPALDPVEEGRRLAATHVLHGGFLHTDRGFVLSWQLLHVPSSTVRTGGTVSVESFDLVAVQNEVCDEVFGALRAGAELSPPAPQKAKESLEESLSESYLQARARLSLFMLRSRHRSDLDEAVRLLEEVAERAPRFAPAHSALGFAQLQYARSGFGGLDRLKTASDSFDRALSLDPQLVESKLYRIYAFLALGEKESARYALRHLLETASGRHDVHLVAGVVLRLDGLYARALEALSRALALHPAGAHVIYYQRARIYHYGGHLDLAMREIEKALALAPDHPLVRTTLGYLQYRLGKIDQAVATLAGVVADEPNLQMAVPSLAMCHAADGRMEQARELVTAATRRAAECDADTAYRLATFYAVAGDKEEALRGLRRSIYLGNENYPWISSNPSWKRLDDDSDFRGILDSLRARHRRNVELWRRLLPHRPPA